jgi:hypothetical protein
MPLSAKTPDEMTHTDGLPAIAHIRRHTKVIYGTEVFDLVTDILADLILEDMKLYPQLPLSPIDCSGEQGNTAPHLPQGKA